MVIKMSEIRLQKYFSDCGVMSRRAAEEEIRKGLVKVNGVTASLGDKIDTERDEVTYKGKTVKMTDRAERGTYILLNKPVGYVSTLSDEKGRLTVKELVRGVKRRVYPVGRLDMYSDGLLILTDDGELTNKLTHPSHSVTKTYVAELIGTIDDEAADGIGDPVEIDGRMTKKAPVRVLETEDGITKVEIILSEGRNRQIRRMCERSGFKIKRLSRVKIGEIEAGELPLGRWRYLTNEEIDYLKGI
ncbi:MAG: rRNA pseudouridine synthase [Clostridia bacterium]|nr:rRNA pseudouridine synthase [Clostridia bacterium]